VDVVGHTLALSVVGGEVGDLLWSTGHLMGPAGMVNTAVPDRIDRTSSQVSGARVGR